jgi:hypothetical protein
MIAVDERLLPEGVSALEVYRYDAALCLGFSLRAAGLLSSFDTRLMEGAARMARERCPEEWERYALYVLGLDEGEESW